MRGEADFPVQRDVYSALISFVLTLVMLPLILFSLVNYTCFDREFYARHYAMNSTASQIGVSPAELEKATDVLLDYLADERGNIDMRLQNPSWGPVEMFNEREKAHMVDVKHLYQTILSIRDGLAILALLLTGWLLYLVWGRRRSVKDDMDISLHALNALDNSNIFDDMSGVNGGGVFASSSVDDVARRQTQRGIRSGILWALFLIAGGLLFLYLRFKNNFDATWVAFHHLFFTNDLWLLDPDSSRMIWMVPASFFSDLVMRILSLSVGSMVIYILVIKLLTGEIGTAFRARKRKG